MAIAKKIEGYPEYYVSSAGNVWREKSNGTYLRLRPNKQGLVSLFTNGKAKSMLVYRLVAQVFVPIPEQYQGISVDELEVHHIDHNRKMNRASNLMWLTKTEHTQLHRESDVTKNRLSAANKGRLFTEEHKQRLSAAKKGHPKYEGSGIPQKAVMQFTKEGVFVAEYASIAEAERLTKVYHGNISNCCSGKRNYAGGYKWSYA